MNYIGLRAYEMHAFVIPLYSLFRFYAFYDAEGIHCGLQNGAIFSKYLPTHFLHIGKNKWAIATKNA